MRRPAPARRPLHTSLWGRVQRGAPMLSERAQWVRRHQERVLPLANVIGCGWGRKQVRGRDTGREGLVVFVREKQPASELKSTDCVPARLAGVETDVLEVGDVVVLGAVGHESGERKSRDRGVVSSARLRGARPGESIWHVSVSAGTLGAVVRDAAPGEPYILSNNHVLSNQTDGQVGRA